MSEKIVIIDKKRRRLRYSAILLVPLLFFCCSIIALMVKNEEVAMVLVFVFLGLVLFSFYELIYTIWSSDKIKFEDECICCKSPKLKSKYVSFLGSAKIPVSEITSVHFRHILPPEQLFHRLCFYFMSEPIGSIDIYDDELIASICLCIFSSKKYIEDVKNFFLQKGIEVKIITEESGDVHAIDETQQIELIESQGTISDMENMNNYTDILFENDAENRTDISLKLSDSRRRNIVNSSNTNSEIKPSPKQNEHKGRRLEL